jgi:hypothetical protein
VERLNGSAHEHALELLAPAAGEAIVAIGFGTGRLVELLAARRLPEARRTARARRRAPRVARDGNEKPP